MLAHLRGGQGREPGRKDGRDAVPAEADLVVPAAPFHRLDVPVALRVAVRVAARADAVVMIRRAMAHVRAFDARELGPHREHAAAAEGAREDEDDDRPHARQTPDDDEHRS